MSPKKAARHTGSESEAWQAGLLVASLSLLFLVAPLVYRLTTKLVEEDYESSVNNTNILGVAATLLFGSIFMLFSNSYFKQLGQQVMQNYQSQLSSINHEQRASFLSKLFASVTATSHHRADERPPIYSSSNHDDAHQDGSARRRIDSKYFKPKFIIHELITFWDTTCTVVTWGSFYVIGGTIVATEKITQKIKSRTPAQRGNSSSSLFGAQRGSSRGTGQSDYSFSSTFGAGSQPGGSTSERQSSRQPFKRISSWTKRSVNSIKKKYSRAVRSNAPQLTSGAANDSSSSIFFFSSN